MNRRDKYEQIKIDRYGHTEIDIVGLGNMHSQ